MLGRKLTKVMRKTVRGGNVPWDGQRRLLEERDTREETWMWKELAMGMAELSILGRGNSKIKNPKAGTNLVCFRNQKEVCVAGFAKYVERSGCERMA